MTYQQCQKNIMKGCYRELRSSSGNINVLCPTKRNRKLLSYKMIENFKYYLNNESILYDSDDSVSSVDFYDTELSDETDDTDDTDDTDSYLKYVFSTIHVNLIYIKELKKNITYVRDINSMKELTREENLMKEIYVRSFNAKYEIEIYQAIINEKIQQYLNEYSMSGNKFYIYSRITLDGNIFRILRQDGGNKEEVIYEINIYDEFLSEKSIIQEPLPINLYNNIRHICLLSTLHDGKNYRDYSMIIKGVFSEPGRGDTICNMIKHKRVSNTFKIIEEYRR